MAKYPKLDLLTVPDDLDVRLQSQVELERIHDESEEVSYLYPVAHAAITLTANECLENIGLVSATDLGVAAFESISYRVNPEQAYDTETERMVSAAAAELFVGRAIDTAQYLDAVGMALERMQEDTPQLTGTLTEILGRHVEHDPVRLRFALQGAAAIRGMQIFVDRRVAKIA